jgi:hypothetical protein
MARPKKKPRERFQITISKPVAKKVRALAKKLDREISEVFEGAVIYILARYKEPPPGAIVVDFPKEEKAP